MMRHNTHLSTSPRFRFSRASSLSISETEPLLSMSDREPHFGTNDLEEHLPPLEISTQQSAKCTQRLSNFLCTMGVFVVLYSFLKALNGFIDSTSAPEMIYKEDIHSYIMDHSRIHYGQHELNQAKWGFCVGLGMRIFSCLLNRVNCFPKAQSLDSSGFPENRPRIELIDSRLNHLSSHISHELQKQKLIEVEKEFAKFKLNYTCCITLEVYEIPALLISSKKTYSYFSIKEFIERGNRDDPLTRIFLKYGINEIRLNKEMQEEIDASLARFEQQVDEVAQDIVTFNSLCGEEMV
jgi:hypothetical protein